MTIALQPIAFAGKQGFGFHSINHLPQAVDLALKIGRHALTFATQLKIGAGYLLRGA